MATHRGLNLSSIAHEGLEGLPGVFIAVFFVFGGVLLLLDLFVPDLSRGAAGTWFAVAYILASIGAGIAYVVSQRRDRRLTAQLEEQFHELSRPADQAGVTTAPAGVVESPVVDRLPSVTPSDALAPEAVLAVVVWFFFLWGMIAMFVTPERQNALTGVFAAISGGIVIASIFLRVRNHWRARRIARGRY
jgi:hypothetical protein